MIKNIMSVIISLMVIPFSFAHNNDEGLVSGNITMPDGKPAEFVSVYLEGTSYGSTTNEKGNYSLSAPEGKYKLVCSGLGFEVNSAHIHVKKGASLTHNLVVKEKANSLQEVRIMGKSATQRVNEQAYNVVAIDAKKFHNTTLDISQALDRISGVRVRESGGVGSNYNFSLNGFTGRQVKFFIDGVPMENFGSSFQINNIPINLADRIEVYKGVVPITFGADALGGAVNIVTSATANKYLDVSYSYGSFNTHRSYINAGYTSKSGFTASINAFQNYSDNDYWVDVDVADVNTGILTNERVKRFHDNYHNETVIANVGVVGKKFADKLLVGMTLGENKADIQTGATMESVFGERFRRGQIVMPSLKYMKKNLFVQNLDLNITGNYNLGYEQTIDTVARRYNWRGEYKQNVSPGSERSRSLYKYNNNNGVLTGNVSYQINQKHSFTVNDVYTMFNRKGKDELYPESESYNQPRKTYKNVLGIGYKFDYNENWNASVFVKQFTQKTSSFVTTTGSGGWGTTEYKEFRNTFNATGYGFATTYFFNKNVQVKASYEKSYRLPENEELFGDVNNLEGNLNLKPESSDNLNLGMSYNVTLNKIHGIILDGNLIYRDASDYIRPSQNANGTHQVMTNQRDVNNIGFNGEARYSYNKLISAGVNMTYQDLRNDTRYDEGSTIESTTYRDRIPNMPYLFGNGDVNIFFDRVGRKENTLSIGYNLLYVQEYYLKWPKQGSVDTKFTVPTQISQDINIVYAIKNGRYNIALECRNIADVGLYDNFNLQKPGRSFYAKFRYFINSH